MHEPPAERPSLGCRTCGTAMPLSRTVVLGNHDRMLQCPQCATITRWSLSAVHSLDLRDAIDADDVIELDLEPEAISARRWR